MAGKAIWKIMNTHDPNMHQKAEGQGLSGASGARRLGSGQAGDQTESAALFDALHVERAQEENKFKAAKNYSRRVRTLKIGLPIVGFLFIAIFIAVAVIAQFSTLPIGISAIDLTNGQVVMDRPTLNGFTSSDSKYEIVAERALQDLTNPKKVLLEKIAATLTLNDGNIVSIEASEGNFNIEGQHLMLKDGIRVHMSAGYSGELDSAAIDVKGGTLTSDGNVFVTADIGEIRANHLTVRDNASFILFEDRVRMIVKPAKIRRTQPPSNKGNWQ